MLTENIIIKNTAGLHAKPASLFVQTANEFTSEIYVCKGSTRVNAKSIMGVMMLAAACGTVLKIEVDGEDEDVALKALVELIASGFGEELGAGA